MVTRNLRNVASSGHYITIRNFILNVPVNTWIVAIYIIIIYLFIFMPILE